MNYFTVFILIPMMMDVMECISRNPPFQEKKKEAIDEENDGVDWASKRP
jgi:hypothetical protein